MLSQPVAVDSLYATGKWFLDQGQAEKAVDIFRVLLLVASSDERGWLGIGASHDALGQRSVALELYALGAQVSNSIRCHVARARVLRALSRDDDACAALDDAEAVLEVTDDEELRGLIQDERRAS